jgi:RNA polymerase sigma-70 factor
MCLGANMNASASVVSPFSTEERCDLATTVDAAYQKGLLAHGDLDLPSEKYRDHIYAVLDKCLDPVSGENQRVDFVKQLHTDDLYLARGCADRGEKAWNRFDALYHKYLNDLIGYLCSLRHVASELMETVMIDLFLPDRSGRSRISSYDGRSSLSTWLRVVVTNRVINEGQRKSNTSRVDISGDFVDGSTVSCLDSRIAMSRYEGLIRESLRHACANLSVRERMILLWRFEDEHQLGDIASRLGVHQSTITRTVERIARKLKQQLISSLSECQLDKAAIEECITVLVDGNDHSISILDFIRSAQPKNVVSSGKNNEVACQ